MYQPAHVDGRSLIILQRRGHKYSVRASGELLHDGEVLELVGEGQRRVVTDQELASFMDVLPNTRLPLCQGFDFFLIVEESI